MPVAVTDVVMTWFVLAGVHPATMFARYSARLGQIDSKRGRFVKKMATDSARSSPAPPLRPYGVGGSRRPARGVLVRPVGHRRDPVRQLLRLDEAMRHLVDRVRLQRRGVVRRRPAHGQIPGIRQIGDRVEQPDIALPREVLAHRRVVDFTQRRVLIDGLLQATERRDALRPTRQRRGGPLGPQDRPEMGTESQFSVTSRVH